MHRVIFILLATLLAAPAVGQNVLVNGGFEMGLRGWNFMRFDRRPPNRTGVTVAPVVAGRSSAALYADFQSWLPLGVGCYYRSDPFRLVPNRIYTLRIDVLWQKAGPAAIPNCKTDVVVQLNYDVVCTVKPPQLVAKDTRASYVAFVRESTPGPHVLNLTFRHGPNYQRTCTILVDNISLGGRDPQLVAAGTGKSGSTIQLSLSSPDDPGLAYALGSSLGTGPIPIGPRLHIGLSLDPLLILSVADALPATFVGYRGVLDGKGDAVAKIRIPSDGRLVGTRIHTAYVVRDRQPGGAIQSVSNTSSFTIR